MGFGISHSVKSQAVRECTAKALQAAIDSPHVARVCAEIVDAKEKMMRGEITREEFETLKNELKKKLPLITPHATFEHGRRVNAEAVESGLCMFDIDHIADPIGFWVENVEPIARELGIVFAHVTPSTEGLRLVFIKPKGLDIEQAQKWLADWLDLEVYDSSVKDLARCSFLVPREYVLWLDEKRLFSPQISTEGQSPLRRGQGDVPSAGESISNGENKANGTSPVPPSQGGVVGVKTFKGTPYAKIIDCWFEQNGGAPEQGERNNKLMKLACELSSICDRDADLMLKVMPRFGLPEAEVKNIIQSSLKENYRRMSYRSMEKAVQAASGITIAKTDKESTIHEEDALPPEMPTKLPKLIELLISKSPELYKPAVAQAVFPSLAAHLWKTTFRYTDNVLHEATLMNVLMAGTGAGKSCIDEPIRRIMKDIRRRDKENLIREKKWKDQVNASGANKTKAQRPSDLVIQCISPDMTNPAFVMRTKEANGHFLYTKMNEIEMFDALKGNGRGGQQFQIMCLAMDPGNTYGQTRVGTQSVTEEVTIRFNWNASTTIGKGQNYFRNVLTNGPISRINFCTIPESPIGSPMPVYGTYDDAFDKALLPYIENLVNIKEQEVVCPQAFELSKKLVDECAEFAQLSQNRVYENLSFRANLIAYLKACVLYVANGCQWEDEMEDFIRWSLEYDLWCKMRFFGEAIEEAENNLRLSVWRGPRSILGLLPPVFGMDEVIQLRLEQDKTEKGVKDMLRTWVIRGHIVRLEDGRFEKTKKRTKRDEQ